MKFPGEGGGALPRRKTEVDGAAHKRNKLSSPYCTTAWELVINKAMFIFLEVVGVVASINTW